MSIIKKNVDVEVREVEGEAVIFHPETESVICLDKCGTMLWKILDGEKKFDDIVWEFYHLFDEKPDYDEFLTDIDEVLTEFVHAGLVFVTEV